MKPNLKRDLESKFMQDFFSCKVWTFVASIVLLVKGYITGQQWVSVLGILFTLRSFDGYSFKQTLSDVKEVAGKVTE